MSYRWIIFAVAAAALGVGAWYFGRPVHPKENPRESRVAELPSKPTEAPKELPPKLIEVIDLTQAYEPVREHDSVAPGNVDLASFIEEQSAPSRIPYAVDDETSPQVCGCCYLSLRMPERLTVTPRVVSDLHVEAERLDVKPREVTQSVGLTLHNETRPVIHGWPDAFPYAPRLKNVNAVSVEQLDVMPREVK